MAAAVPMVVAALQGLAVVAVAFVLAVTETVVPTTVMAAVTVVRLSCSWQASTLRNCG
jgi:K+ transporter